MQVKFNEILIGCDRLHALNSKATIPIWANDMPSGIKRAGALGRLQPDDDNTCASELA